MLEAFKTVKRVVFFMLLTIFIDKTVKKAIMNIWYTS